MDADRQVPHNSRFSSSGYKHCSNQTFLRNLTLTSYLYLRAMIQHKSTTDAPGATVSMDIATRQMSTASFDLRPASDIEILGIATATCLLALFLCYMLYTGLRMLSYASFAVKTSWKRGETPRSVCEWSATHSQPRASYDGQQEDSRTPYFANSARNTRMKTPWGKPVIMKQYYHTQIPARRKPLSRKPLPMSNSMISSIRWKDTTLDMEEGWSLRSDATASVADKYDDATRPNETTSYRESKVKENGGYSDRSFLHSYTASLGRVDVDFANMGR
ncbi:hypothetical protein F4824DRAFT_30579 [Ustulina deusta]|nr:hypothetical protein F4824DRAFT_30579 [Ustulina deusta]